MKPAQHLTAIIKREEDCSVALCPDLDVASEGASIEETRTKLQQVGRFGRDAPSRGPTQMTLEVIKSHLRIRARDYFPSLRGPLTIQMEPVREESTNPLRRFVISDGKTQARVIAKWAPAYANNNEGLTEYQHYHSFNSGYDHGSPALRCPPPLREHSRASQRCPEV